MYDPLAGLSPAEIDEVRSGARSMINDPAFKVAIRKMEENALETLKSEHVGSLTAATAHATIKVIETFKTELSLLVAGERFNQRRR